MQMSQNSKPPPKMSDVIYERPLRSSSVAKNFYEVT